MQQRKRKAMRLKGYNYSSPGAYFITICVKNREEILSQTAPAKDELSMPVNELLWHGEIADKYIRQMSSFYDDIKIEKYIIMPNHIHLIVMIMPENIGEDIPLMNANNKISKFVGTFKRFCNKQYGENIWQARFHDHVIRNEKEYNLIWEYINSNTLKWKEDCFYISHD